MILKITYTFFQDLQENNQAVRVSLFSVLSREMLASIQSVVEFAKRIPGFTSLPQDDQLILIKSGFFEIWTVYVAPMTTKDTITLSDGLTLSRKHLDIVYDVSIYHCNTRDILRVAHSGQIKVDTTFLWVFSL